MLSSEDQNSPYFIVPSSLTDVNDGISSLNSPQRCLSKSVHNEGFKSAFHPYRLPPASGPTVLTNLQRGNTQAPALLPEKVKPDYHMKAGQGELNPEDILLEEDIDIVDSNGLTALHWASAYGQLHTVNLLIEYGADVNRLSSNEETPLIFAANGGHHEIVKLLLANNADVNHIDHLCNTALMYACKGNYPHSCQELLSSGANFGLINLNDDTALNIAVENNSTSAQTVLQNHIVSIMEKQLKSQENNLSIN